MKDYLEAMLHRTIQLQPYDGIKKLPLFYRYEYNLSSACLYGQNVLLAEPMGEIPLTTIKKQYRQLEHLTGWYCIMALRSMSNHARESLVKNDIAFVWKGNQIYIPFLGILLNSNKARTIPRCNQMSFLTQRLLLTAFYQDWKQVNVTQAAEKLGVTKTSITNSFHEIEALNIDILTSKGRSRKLTIDDDKRQVWENIKDKLRNPVITTYELVETPQDKNLCVAGETALAYYSMLGEPQIPVLAVSKKDLSSLKINHKHLAKTEDSPSCLLQEIGYRVNFGEGKTIDPLSLVLSLDDEQKDDPRVSMCVDEMLERYVWSEE